MRNNKWIKLIAVVLCLSMLLLGLVACVNDDDTDDDNKGDNNKPVVESLSDALNTATERIQNSYVVSDAKYFSVDVLADAELSSLGENAGRIWKYELLAKANIKLIEDATEDETSMRVEINSYSLDADGNDVKTTLFGIFYENEINANGNAGNYFYITLAGSEPIKTNAFSMYKLLNAAAPDTVAATDGMDIGAIIKMVLSLIITDFEAADNDYVFMLNLQQVWETVYGLLSEVVDLDNITSLGDMLGGTAGEIVNMILSGVDGSIADIFPDLTYNEIIEDDFNTPDVDESEVIEKPVTNIKSLLEYVNQSMPSIDVKINLNFDSNNVFESARVSAAYQARNEEGVYNNPTHEFKLNADKVYVGAHNDVAVDEGYALTKEEREALNDVVNLLNFSINGTLEMIRNDVEILPYSINADINPFVLFDGVTVDTIKQLGYLNITVDAPETQSYRNILTIHADFSSGSLYLNFKPYGESPLLKNLNIGGKIELNALFDAITMLSGGKVDVASAADESGSDDILTGILGTLFGALDFSDIKNNGLLIDTSSDTIKNIFKNIDLGDALANMFLPGIVRTMLFNNADTMSIKVNENGIVYGACEKENLSNIDFTAFREGDVVGVENPKLGGDFKTSYEYGQPLTDGITWNGKSGDNAMSFDVKGKHSITGQYNAVMSAKYLGTTFDPYKVGEQKIRIYFGANNSFNNLGGTAGGAVVNLLAGMPMLPINGMQYIETTVNVLEPVDEETAFVNIRGVNQLGVGEDIAEMLDGELIYANGRKVDITSDMISSKKDVIENGKIMYPGEWTLDVNYYSAHATVKVIVGELFVNDITEIAVGRDDIIKTLNPRLKLLNANGAYEYNNCNTEIASISIDGKATTAEDAFVADTFILQQNHNWLDKNIVINLEYDMFGMNRTREFSFKIVAGDKAAISKGTTSFNFNYSYSNLAKITKDGVVYYVRYNTEKSKFEAAAVVEEQEIIFTDNTISMNIARVKDADGNKLTQSESLDLSLGYFRKAGEYEYTLRLDNDAYFSSSFTVKTPIIGNKTLKATDKFYVSSSLFSVYCDGSNLVNDELSSLGGAISIKYIEGDVEYAPCVQLKDKSYKRVGNITFKDSEGNAVEPVFHSKPYSTTYLKFDAAGAYTATLTIEIAGVKYTATSTIQFSLS